MVFPLPCLITGGWNPGPLSFSQGTPFSNGTHIGNWKSPEKNAEIGTRRSTRKSYAHGGFLSLCHDWLPEGNRIVSKMGVIWCDKSFHLSIDAWDVDRWLSSHRRQSISNHADPSFAGAMHKNSNKFKLYQIWSITLCEAWFRAGVTSSNRVCDCVERERERDMLEHLRTVHGPINERTARSVCKRLRHIWEYGAKTVPTIYLSIYLSIYIYVHIHIYVYIYTYIYIYTHTYLYNYRWYSKTQVFFWGKGHPRRSIMARCAPATWLHLRWKGRTWTEVNGWWMDSDPLVLT